MECKRKAASYETYAAKNKEINILSVKKGRRKNSNVDVVYIFNTLAHTFYVNDIEREWAPESEWNEEKKSAEMRSDVKRTAKTFRLKTEWTQSLAKGARKWKEIWKSFRWLFSGEYENIYGILCIIRHAYVNRKTK